MLVSFTCLERACVKGGSIAATPAAGGDCIRIYDVRNCAEKRRTGAGNRRLESFVGPQLKESDGVQRARSHGFCRMSSIVAFQGRRCDRARTRGEIGSERMTRIGRPVSRAVADGG